MFCASPKNACGIQTKGLERVYKMESETEVRRSHPVGLRGSRLSHATIHAFGASRLASSDLKNKTDWIAVTFFRMYFNLVLMLNTDYCTYVFSPQIPWKFVSLSFRMKRGGRA